MAASCNSLCDYCSFFLQKITCGGKKKKIILLYLINFIKKILTKFKIYDTIIFVSGETPPTKIIEKDISNRIEKIVRSYENNRCQKWQTNK